MPEQIFTYLSIIIGVVLVSLWIMKLLKQPMIIWYIVAGTIISIAVPNLLSDNHSLETFSTIGISFLLFIVWLELNLKVIKDVWKTSIITGLLQVVLTAIIGYWLGLLLWFETLTALYLWIGFAFSSTIVILKLLSDKGNTDSVYGKISIGILIIQDIIVMLLFLWIATVEQIQWGSGLIVASTLLAKMIWLWIWLYLLSKYILPIATKRIAESQEHLFLFSIWRCLILGSLFHFLGFSIEIGALIAGVTLASSPYKFEIISKVKPLRDFFIVLFFVLLGSRISFPINPAHIIPIVIFSLFILIIKPIIVMFITGKMGHTKKNSFLTWTGLGQISEFSFILIMLWISLWHIKSDELISMVTIIWFITIAVSSYQILYWQKIYNKIKKYPKLLKLLPGKLRKKFKTQFHEHEIILFGYGRFGSQLFDSINKNSKEKILVIDENPDIIDELLNHNIPCIYGDAGELDFLEEISLKNTKMVISTIKNYDDTLLLLKTIKKQNPKIIVILITHNTQEGVKYYEEGADYIILPHQIGAHHASTLLEENWFDINKFIEKKEKHLAQIKAHEKKSLLNILKLK